MRILVSSIILVFAANLFGQQAPPKVEWRKLGSKYQSIYEVQPSIINLSDETVYFDCLPSEVGTFSNYGYDDILQVLHSPRIS